MQTYSLTSKRANSTYYTSDISQSTIGGTTWLDRERSS